MKQTPTIDLSWLNAHEAPTLLRQNRASFIVLARVVEKEYEKASRKGWRRPETASASAATRYIGGAVIVLFFGGVFLLTIVYQMALEVRQENAREFSKSKVDLISDMRSYYSSIILPITKAHGLDVAHDFRAHEGVLPLPATLTKELALKQQESAPSSFNFYSLYPFKNSQSNKTLSEFERDALLYFERTGESEYWGVTSEASGDTFRYAAAVFMGQSCVDCHNAHPNSSKNDWKVGDLRGATSIHSEFSALSPIKEPITARYFTFMVTTLAISSAIAGVLFWKGRRLVERSQLREVKRRNQILENARTKLRRVALHDALTGLPNRLYLEQTFSKIQRHGGQVVVMHIDLDRFKQINDTFGHDAGDHVLKHVAALLTEVMNRERFVARIGGDEFVIVSMFDGMRAPLKRFATDLVAKLREPILYKGKECLIGGSVGVAIDAHPQTALINAHIALYKAKNGGRNGVVFFSEELQQELVETKKTADEILKGLENDEFFPVYQPQFDARTLELVGVEALARWRHPERGVLDPSAFLAVATDLGADAKIDQVVLEKALDDKRVWDLHGLRVPKVAVNVSMRRLVDPQLIASVERLEFQPGELAFELLEAVFLDDCDPATANNIASLKALGIDIEIDDFGSGHASVISLLETSPTRLKIDRKLVGPIAESPDRLRLIASIVEIGRSLGVSVTAEGVSSWRHVELLRESGCDVLQGFALGRPMPSEDLLVAAATWRKEGERGPSTRRA